MANKTQSSFKRDFRRFFVRGLAILLPTVITIWILIAVYRFVDVNIAGPLNRGVQRVVLLTPWPQPQAGDLLYAGEHLSGQEEADWAAYAQGRREELGAKWTAEAAEVEREAWLRPAARAAALRRIWGSVGVGGWAVMDLIGLVIAIVLIYSVGAAVTSFVGHRIYRRGEQILGRVPLIKQLYPSIKQVTDFFFGDGQPRARFSQVVAVEYPRVGVWSVALVTGGPIQMEGRAGEGERLTLFVPTAPTPFTGYVIVVRKADTIELPMSIEEALRFIISGGLVRPQRQWPALPFGAAPGVAGAAGDAKQPWSLPDKEGACK